MSINNATPQDWDRVRETGEPTFEEYRKRLKFSWVHDGTKPAPQTAYKEDVDLFGNCWDVKESTLDEQMKAYLDAAEKEQAEYEAFLADGKLTVPDVPKVTLEMAARNGQHWCFETEQPLPYEEDAVANPSHYNTGNIECIEAIEESMSAEAFAGYLKGNCMKYLWRYDYKGKPVEDLQKAQWYLAKLLEEVMFDTRDWS